MEPLELEDLRRQVTARFGTIHAFAKKRPGGLARSTVYQVLSGKYGGDVERQVDRIRAALGENGQDIFNLLKKVACARCRKKRRRSKQCERCFELWRAQERELRGAVGRE